MENPNKINKTLKTIKELKARRRSNKPAQMKYKIMDFNSVNFNTPNKIVRTKKRNRSQESTHRPKIYEAASKWVQNREDHWTKKHNSARKSYNTDFKFNGWESDHLLSKGLKTYLDSKINDKFSRKNLFKDLFKGKVNQIENEILSHLHGKVFHSLRESKERVHNLVEAHQNQKKLEMIAEKETSSSKESSSKGSPTKAKIKVLKACKSSETDSFDSNNSESSSKTNSRNMNFLQNMNKIEFKGDSLQDLKMTLVMQKSNKSASVPFQHERSHDLKKMTDILPHSKRRFSTQFSMKTKKNSNLEFEDTLVLQQDLIKILEGVSAHQTAEKPSFLSIKKCFTALERISTESESIKYYIDIICRVLKKSVYCKGFEIPEILFEQMKTNDNNMSVKIDDDIPYFQIIEESLISLSKVVKKTREVERECRIQVQDLKSQLNIKEFQWNQYQSEFDSMKTLNHKGIQTRYLELTEQIGKLSKENHKLYYQKEHSKEEAENLSVKLEVKIDELTSAREEIKSLQADINSWEKKYNKLFKQKAELLMKIKTHKV
ncbi:unnamed protein product [Moneuplotes crassus]|uniref:Uncharacterized protein n=1 Tax=Euplotes crassus TaxID=5936 RepID=A0AAD1YAX7_EUPCR|nr:unnamed protein product [Moneuplotes crassus]